MFFEESGLGLAIANLALIGILVHVIIEDLRHYRIYNRAILALAIMFLLSSLLQHDWENFTDHLVFGGIMSLILLGLYAGRVMGGGDIKLLMVAFFWLGHEQLLPFLIAMAVLVILYIAGVKLNLFPARTRADKVQIPFAPAIAGGWITVAGLTLIF